MELLVPKVISLIFEVGGHDGAYKGRIHVIVPFIGRKNGTLPAANDSAAAQNLNSESFAG